MNLESKNSSKGETSKHNSRGPSWPLVLSKQVRQVCTARLWSSKWPCSSTCSRGALRLSEVFMRVCA